MSQSRFELWMTAAMRATELEELADKLAQIVPDAEPLLRQITQGGTTRMVATVLDAEDGWSA